MCLSGRGLPGLVSLGAVGSETVEELFKWGPQAPVPRLVPGPHHTLIFPEGFLFILYIFFFK